MLLVAQSDSIHYQIIIVSGGFGYDVYINDVKVIHQPIIPGIEGESAFTSRADATETAELVVSKIKKGIVPPTVSSEELESIIDQHIQQ